jgi:O-antigen ligase
VGGGFGYFFQTEKLQVVNPNALAFLPITALVAGCMGLSFASERRGGQLVLAILCGLNFVLVFLTGSRGGMLTATACATFMILGIRGLGRRTVIVSLIALTAVAALSQFTELQTYALARIHILFDPSVSLTDRTSGRADLALAGWHMFRDHPLGIGTGGFGITWSSLGISEGLSGWGLGKVKPAHAGWIKILVENGIPGILFFSMFLGSFLMVGWRNRHRGLLPLGLLATLVLGLGFLTTEYQSKGLWFIAAGVMILLRRRTGRAQLGRAASQR